MFKKFPKVLAHISALNQGNFVTPEYILNKDNTNLNLFKRFCPHRMYPLADPGSIVENITCKFHNFKWDRNGIPLNNDKKLNCGTPNLGISGLIFKDFIEPDHSWVNDIQKEKNLKYSHSVKGSSNGSWLWLMDAEADLLHIFEEGIHPFLSRQVKIQDVELDQGDGWILQTHPHGWWLYVFPYSFVEYGNPGMVMVNHVVPKDPDNEFGFDWIIQYYYDDNVSVDRRMVFETLERVFQEDIDTAEKQKGKYFPLMKASNKYEDHCVHWGQWIKENLLRV